MGATAGTWSGASASAGAGLHVTFWHAIIAQVFILIAFTVHLLRAYSGHTGAGAGWWIAYAGFWVLLGATVALWNRWLFFPVHLRRLLAARGVESFKVDRDWARVRTPMLWVLFDYDSPLFDYLPFAGRGLRKVATPGAPGASPADHYMHDRAVVHVFVPSRRSELPAATVRVGHGAPPRWLDGTSDDPQLLDALAGAARELSEPGLRITVELNPQWLRAEVHGGSWLGSRFARRIEDTVSFVEALTRGLGGRFQARQAADVIIEPEADGFACRPAGGKDGDASMRVRATPVVRHAALALTLTTVLAGCFDDGPVAGNPAGVPDAPRVAAPAPGAGGYAPDHAPRAAAADAWPAPDGGPVSDPAMVQPAARGRSAPAPGDAATVDETLRLDAGNERLYLPGRGWLATAEVRTLYLEHPGELPADVDLARLHRLLDEEAGAARQIAVRNCTTPASRPDRSRPLVTRGRGGGAGTELRNGVVHVAHFGTAIQDGRPGAAAHAGGRECGSGRRPRGGDGPDEV